MVLGDLHANEISEPDDVLDLELLELEIGEEDTEVESVLEGHGVSTGGLIKDDIVDGCFSIHGFIALVLVEVGGGEHGLVVSAIKSLNEGFGVLGFVELGHEVGVKVAQLSEVLGSGGLLTSGVVKVVNSKRVVDDVDSSHITLEL